MHKLCLGQSFRKCSNELICTRREFVGRAEGGDDDQRKQAARGGRAGCGAWCGGCLLACFLGLEEEIFREGAWRLAGLDQPNERYGISPEFA